MRIDFVFLFFLYHHLAFGPLSTSISASDSFSIHPRALSYPPSLSPSQSTSTHVRTSAVSRSESKHVRATASLIDKLVPPLPPLPLLLLVVVVVLLLALCPVGWVLTPPPPPPLVSCPPPPSPRWAMDERRFCLGLGWWGLDCCCC